jgi:AcrR family transcriptional regulator
MSALQNRREREIVEMRQLIVDAAIKLFIEEGYEKVSIRSIAQRIQYAPGTIYLYFKDRDALFFAMHEWAFKKLMVVFETNLRGINNPIEKLRAMSATYVNFSFKNPELYDLMFILQEPMCAEENAENWACGLAVFKILQDIIDKSFEQNLLKGDSAPMISFMFWSSLHGMVSLHLRNRLRMYDGLDLESLIQHTSETLLNQFLIVSE